MPRTQALGRREIPVFSLYGEAAARQEDDFVHIEEIRTRSERYAWQIGSHTHHGLFQVLFLISGRVELHLDGTAHRLDAPCVVTVPPATVHEFHFTPGTEGYVLTIAESLFAEDHSGRRALIESLLPMPRATDLASAPETVARLSALLDQIAAESRDRGPGAPDMQEWLIASVLLLAARAQASDRRMSEAARPEIELFNRFRVLVEKHYLEHRPAPFYAQSLGVTLSRLNRACRAAANKSAFDVAQERLLLEARRKLIYIAAPVSLLAYELGFEDPAYFWRFFRRRAGLTPAAFRRDARARAGHSGAA